MNQRTTDTPSKEGFRAARVGVAKKWCPYQDGHPSKPRWLAGWLDGAKVGRGIKNDSPWCEQPTDCRALRSKLCRRCHMKKNHADPTFQMKRDARVAAAGHAQRAAHPALARANILKAQKMRAESLTPSDRAALADRLRKLSADADFREKRRAGIARRFSDPEQRRKQGEIMVKNTRTPQVNEKRKITRLALNQDMPRSKRRKIAHEVRDTTDSYVKIGKRFAVSETSVRNCAKEFGTHRGPWRRPKKLV